MKRSEKEAEVRRLLETYGAVVQLPANLRLNDVRLYYRTADELITELVDAAEPKGGWKPENRTWKASPVVGPAGTSYVGAFYGPGKIHHLQHSEAQEIADAYNAMKEAEEAEADPNDPLTVGLERLAAEEIATLIADAAKVTREETIRQLAEKCVSKYTREEFVAAEVQAGIDAQGIPGVDFEELDQNAEEAIRKRAEWNAQAAERAGIVWRHQSTKVACRNCGGYEWPEKISDYGECRKCVSQRLEQEDADMEPVATGGTESTASTAHFIEDAETRSMNRVQVLERQKTVPATSNQAWIHYCDDGLYIHHTIPRETFNAGWDYGYKAGWWARMDTLNPVCSPEAVDETLAADAAPIQETSALQPCPFCGSNDLTENRRERYGNSNVGWLSILCHDCGARGPEVREAQKVSIEAREGEVAEVESKWNSRYLGMAKEVAAGISLLDGLEPTPGIGDAPASHRDLQALARVVARQHDRISTVENRLADALAAIDEINRQFGDEVRWRRDVARIEGKVEAAAAVASRVESEWKIQGQKYTADLRRVSHVNGELVQRVVVLEADNATNKDSLRELRDLGQRALDRLDQHTSSSAVSITLLRESIDGAHDRLQMHDLRITALETEDRN